MTEAEWLVCTDPIMMAEFLRGSPVSEDTATWWNSKWRLENGRLPKNWSRCYVSPPGIVQGGTHEQATDRCTDSTRFA